MGIFQRLFGPKADFAMLIAEGAPIIDVRTKGEYDSGALPGSHHVTINALRAGDLKFDKSKPVIVVCASGIRSGAAKRVMKGMGYDQVYNGGSWASLIKYFPE